MPVQYKDYYTVLGVARTATQEEIKQAFRKLARQFHPDVAKDKKRAEERFKEINEANEVLSNPETRRKYDELGENWQHGADFRPPSGWGGKPGRASQQAEAEFHFGGTGFSDFFEQFFGRSTQPGGRPNFRGAPPGAFAEEEFAERGQDIEGDLLVTLNEAALGAVRPITVREVNPRTGQTETRTFQARIPVGIQEGQMIRLRGKGEEGSGGAGAGDLYLHVRFAAHPDFRAQGADLYHELDLTPWEAALGANVKVPTLDGHVTVKIPPGTNTGQTLRLRNRGLPRGTTGRRGDLLVVAQVRVPTETTPEERELWKRLAQVSTFKPREE
jgi:curved DNA-binding protein